MQAGADLEQVQAWAAELETLCERIAPHLGRVEVRRRVGAVLRGLLGEIERKNGWQLAEHAGEATPDGIQRLLNQARWDVERVRDELRAYVAEHLGDAGGVLVVDETGFLKKGSKSAGVQRQYSGTAGRIENCQVGVFLAYTSASGHALVDRELYVPQAWIEDRPRCRAAAIPDTVEFRTKPQLARAMLERALDAGVPFGWVTGDEIYGQDRRLRLWLEARQIPHVLAVKRSEPLVSMRLGFERAETLVAGVDPAAWQRVSAGAGAKGERLYDWAAIPIRPLREPGVGHWLLARRALATASLPTTCATARPRPRWRSWCGSPAPAGRWSAACSRPRARWGWTTTRSAATTPGTATSPWRCLPMPAWRSCGRRSPGPPRLVRPTPTQGVSEGAELADLLVPLSVPEIRRLLVALVWRLSNADATKPARVLAWSRWRRRHQARARRCHYQRRQARAEKLRL
jgi:DDE superfamily endonuclease